MTIYVRVLVYIYDILTHLDHNSYNLDSILDYNGYIDIFEYEYLLYR